MTFYIRDNNESTRNAYNKKIIYKNTIAQTNSSNIVDFSFTEKALYGKVKSNGVPVVMITRNNLKDSKYGAGPNRQPVRALNFVVDVFDEMCLEFERKVQANKISTNSKFLTNLRAYKGYSNPVDKYNSYREIYDVAVAKAFRHRNYQPENFDDFVKQFYDVIKFVSEEIRFTLPGYVKSFANSPLTTGLAIEVASNVKYTSDDEKVSKFVTDPNWQFFVQTCNSYGFMVDLNTPWRIVADLDSEIMRAYSFRYGYGTALAVLDGAYTPAYVQHFRSFIDDLISVYDRVRTRSYIKTYVCDDGSVKTKRIESKVYDRTALLKEYGFDYFLKQFITLRLHEEMPNSDQSYVNEIIREVMGFSSTSLQGKLEQFEILINKEVDKIGSYNYIIKQVREKEETNFESGETSAISSY